MTAEHPARIGPYEVLGLLGQGAMGQVYKAVQPPANRLVAIKVLPAELLRDEDRVERFEREAQAVARLDHPNVVRILDKDRDGELLYFVMEYVPGTSLAAVLHQRRLSLHEVFRVAKGICRGLEAAHRQNIVHRDLNPRNVLVSEDLSVVKLADFGISRVEEISLQHGTLSTTEFSLGSLHYMSPEQATNMVETDQRTDIYSLGVTLYEMLTGRVPVGRFGLPSRINHEVPSDIDPLVLKCLETDPTDRYRTVSQVLTELTRLEDRLKLGLVHELKGISRQTSKIFLKSTGTFRSPKRRRLATGVAVLALAAAAGAFFLWRRQAAVPEATSAPPSERQVIAFELPQRPQDSAPAALTDGLADVQPPPPDEPTASERLAPAPGSAATAAPASADDVALVQARKDLAVARDKLAAGLNGPALEDLERFADEHASSPLVPEAYLMMAQAHLAAGRTEAALATYVEVGSRFAASAQAPAAAFERARLVEQGPGKEAALEARQLYIAVAADHPETRWAPAALAAQARIEMELKLTVSDPILDARAPGWLAPCRALAERYATTAEAEWAFWQLGEAYAELREFDRAAESFAELGRRFPATSYDAWWRAGQIYDRRLDRKPEAIEAYRQVPETSSHHNDARKRLGRLSR